MLYMLMSEMGWPAFIVLLIIAVVLYRKLSKQLEQLRQDMVQMQADLQQHKDSFRSFKSSHFVSDVKAPPPLAITAQSTSPSAPPALPEALINSAPANTADTVANNPRSDDQSFQTSPHQKLATPIMDPDEHSKPIVTSLFNSLKNWFLGGNLVVRVGVLVLLVGVVLLLRLLSEYIEIPIQFKLTAIGVAGLGLAGLGLKLAARRFAYGITLQGTGLAIAYLSTFFAYRVYQVIPSLPSFMMLGLLSAVTVAFAVRQNAFPLALLALSGGFFAPLLTSTDTSSLSALFSYYLVLNVSIAIIAHYRTWKVLNLLGVAVTFGLAYYWGATEDFTTVIASQRWTLVLLVALHLILYLFVAIRYAQQIIAYNLNNDIKNAAVASHSNAANISATVKAVSSLYLFPIDMSLLFSVPVLAFGLFAALLNDITHALTTTSAILAAIYLGLGWLFTQHSQRYALITEGMLALGLGFLALIIPLAFDAEWVATGWSLQGLALVWFGRRSLRAWSILFGLVLQLTSVGMLLLTVALSIDSYPLLAITLSAFSYLATMFVLRASNSPVTLSQAVSQNLPHTSGQTTAADTLPAYAKALGISTAAAQQWLLVSINNNSTAFNVIWRSPIFMRLLTLSAIIWLLSVLVIDLRQWFSIWPLATTTLLAMATLISISVYWIIDRYRSWSEIRQFSHGLLLVLSFMLVIQLPQKFELNILWATVHWAVFITLIVGWLLVGQLWLKTWHSHIELSRYDSASWLGTGILVIAAAVHYGLADSKGVMTILIPVVLMLAGLWLSYRSRQPKNISEQHALYWFNWQQALLDSAKTFVPVTLIWAVISNGSADGIIWGLPYLPLLNLYDLTLCVVIVYGLGVYYLKLQQNSQKLTPLKPSNKVNNTFSNDWLLIILALISFWIISSMLIRTLHAFIGTPLWNGNAWGSEQVQTALTILWTLLALIATIIASRYWQRALWFMGIGLLGLVVLKLVLVDLSQTEAIWRVISFLGAGSLILLIGYLAPLPPTNVKE